MFHSPEFYMVELTVTATWDESTPLDLPNFIRRIERACLEKTLAETANHKTRAAKALCLNRTTFVMKLRDHEIQYIPEAKKEDGC